MPDSKRLNWPTARANLLWTRCVWHSGVLCGFLFSVNLCRGMSNAIRSGGVWTALVNRRFCHFLGSCHHFLCVSDSLMTFRWCELIIVCLSSLWQDITERNTISRFTSFHYVFFKCEQNQAIASPTRIASILSWKNDLLFFVFDAVWLSTMKYELNYIMVWIGKLLLRRESPKQSRF